MSDFTISKSMRLPSLIADLSDANGPINLASVSAVKFYMSKNSVSKIAGSVCVVVNPSAGTVRYDWGVSDTNVTGIFQAQFEITVSGKTQRIPDDGYLEINIQPAD